MRLYTAAILFLLTSLAQAQSTDDGNWKKIEPYFSPPKELANDFGKYKSPLTFDDGRVVEDPKQWPARRKEVLAYWHKTMGAWPAPIQKPEVVKLGEATKGENFTQQKVRIQIDTNERNVEGYLLTPDGPGPFPAVIVVFYEAETSVGAKKSEFLDWGLQLAKRGFVTLSIGSPPSNRPELQPLSYHAYVASNCYNALRDTPKVDAKRVGIIGHSYGGKWAMFASCLDDRFAAAVWCDGGIVFDESRDNVNYWEKWYLGQVEGAPQRETGMPSEQKPRTGAYKTLFESGRDLHELHALMAPRPFLVSGGSEDPIERWKALNHTVAVNKLLGQTNRVALTTRPHHNPDAAANEAIIAFFEHFLKKPATTMPSTQPTQ